MKKDKVVAADSKKKSANAQKRKVEVIKINSYPTALKQQGN